MKNRGCFMRETLKTIPKVDTVLKETALKDLPYSQDAIKQAVNEVLSEIRTSILSGSLRECPDAEGVASLASKSLLGAIDGGLKRVINASGVIVHTNLGRAPLAKEAIDAVIEVARGYSNLEIDLDKGTRGSRQDHIDNITKYCFGSEAALVVNNNAAAVLLTLASLASGKEVIVSRGELIEIGGSFRMPDVMAVSSAVLREVGTTNKTRLADYEEAITENTAIIMKVHRSNFSIEGFTEEVDLKSLASLAHSRGLLFYVDMGSGVFLSLENVGISGEWTIKECFARGADIITFSGDKILGGPQAGVILGRKDLISLIARNPLHRAVRVGKLTIAALRATLKLYLDGEYNKVPVFRMIYEDPVEVKRRAVSLHRRLRLKGAKVLRTSAVIGGGSAPTKTIPSFGLSIVSSLPNKLHERLRSLSPPVLARIDGNTLIFDMKAVSDSEIALLADKIKEALCDVV